MDRTSEQDARTLLESLLPDPELRRLCLTLLADAIDAAHARGPAVWEVTLRDHKLTLNVGRLYLMRIGKGVVWMVLARKALTPEELALVESLSEDDGALQFSVVKEYVHVALPIERLPTLLPVVQRILKASVDLCADTVKYRTPFYKCHSPGILTYLSTTLNRSLPTPDFEAGVIDTPPDGASLPLSSERIVDAWTRAFPRPAWDEWQQGYLELLQTVHRMSDEVLRRPENQKLLWSGRALTPLGPGENVRVDGAWTDPKVVDAIIAVRHQTWPESPLERANKIQETYKTLMAMVYDTHTKYRPIAKLHRLLAILLPGELHCAIQWRANSHVMTLLLPPDQHGEVIFSQVMARARLREVLGPELNLEEQVDRSTFCWYLHERYDELCKGPEVLDDEKQNFTGEKTETQPRIPEPPPPLVIWPIHKQMRGANYVANPIELFREFLRTAIEGVHRDELIDLVAQQETYRTLARTSLATMLMELNRLGFLEHRPNDQVFPNAAGMELLEDEQPEILVERMLERVFGVAHILRFLSQAPEGLTGKALTEKLQAVYPQWTAQVMPTRMRLWCATLSLIERPSRERWRLSDIGQAYAARLPDSLPEPPIPVVEGNEIDEDGGNDEASSTPNGTLRTASLEDILRQFRESPDVAHFVFDEDLLTTLHAAWHCNPRKRFVLLSGLSGTGKTAITRCYAQILCGLLGLNVKQHLEIIPVSPDWRDPSGLLGYFNALHAEPTFQAEPALRLVLRAVEDPLNPYFLVLDEMNLARAERYFAPFLSAMETGESLVLHTHAQAVNGIPERVKWPTNLFIAGTVNMDETTHPFSDKVLDRAFTLEFWEVDLARFFQRQADATPGQDRLHDVEKLLLDLNAALRRIRRHFGYRTAGEVLAFVRQAKGRADAIPWRLVDHAIFAKVLPRLRGEDSNEMKQALKTARELCSARGLTRCVVKLEDLSSQLKHSGMAGFFA